MHGRNIACNCQKDGDLRYDSCTPLKLMHEITFGLPSLLDNSLCYENDVIDLCEPTTTIPNLRIHCPNSHALENEEYITQRELLVGIN
jgi:hypothetical protein